MLSRAKPGELSYHYRVRRIRLSRSRRGLESLVGSPLTTADIALTSPGRDSSDRERRMASGRGMGAGSQELCVWLPGVARAPECRAQADNPAVGSGGAGHGQRCREEPQ